MPSPTRWTTAPGRSYANSWACLSIWCPITAPAAPPTTAPMIAPRTVEPVAWPMTAPAAPPAPAPMIAPFSALFMAQLSASGIRAAKVSTRASERLMGATCLSVKDGLRSLKATSGRSPRVSHERGEGADLMTYRDRGTLPHRQSEARVGLHAPIRCRGDEPMHWPEELELDVRAEPAPRDLQTRQPQVVSGRVRAKVYHCRPHAQIEGRRALTRPERSNPQG